MKDYQELVNEQAAAMGVKPLPVERSESVQNAMTDGATIKANPSWFSPIEASMGEEGVRFILSHELGHAHGGMVGGHDGEHQADRWAARSMAVQGVHIDRFVGVMGFLNQSASETHPGAPARRSEVQRAHEAEIETSTAQANSGLRNASRSAR